MLKYVNNGRHVYISISLQRTVIRKGRECEDFDDVV